MPKLSETRISCIGSGIMGGVLVRRLVGAGAVPASQVTAADPDATKLEALAKELGVATSGSNPAAAAGADVAILAPPPPAIVPVLSEIAGALKPGALIVSVAPGANLATMRRATPDGVSLARVMPNTPTEVGSGMNAFVCEAGISPEARSLLQEMLDVWGCSLEIDESQFNACCALLAVGPTYLFPLVGQLIESAQAAGLSAEQARLATARLFHGVGAIVEQSERTPEALQSMISMQPMDAPAACKLVGDAYCGVLGKLNEVQAKLSG